jgi:hypothetical protein
MASSKQARDAPSCGKIFKRANGAGAPNTSKSAIVQLISMLAGTNMPSRVPMTPISHPISMSRISGSSYNVDLIRYTRPPRDSSPAQMFQFEKQGEQYYQI